MKCKKNLLKNNKMNKVNLPQQIFNKEEFKEQNFLRKD